MSTTIQEARVTKHTPSICTVGGYAPGGKCGKPAVWSNGEFAECAEHVKDAISLSKSSSYSDDPKVNDFVSLKAYGGTYYGRVTWVGRKNGKVRITLQSGAEKVITRPLSEMTVTQI